MMPTLTPCERMPYIDEFKSRFDLKKAFCDTAKNYIQISSAALALPIIFTQSIFGKDAAEKGFWVGGVPFSLGSCWVCFLIAIGLGLAYQWLVIRGSWDELHAAQITERNAAQPGFRTTWWVPQFRNFNRSILYGGMVGFFYLGAILFVWFAWGTFASKPKPPVPSPNQPLLTLETGLPPMAEFLPLDNREQKREDREQDRVRFDPLLLIVRPVSLKFLGHHADQRGSPRVRREISSKHGH